ncbi:glycosyl transferase group 1 [Thermodesulfatator indicus DSM 15286]|uniref:Glycosyl transferase group 1 n=1 Tax=Thermodesulfatator indicus (strain DSM 15286 / JCM 11887 / CIR29812) TaxID=667014 RepID=F8AC35_THEID|nr:glycosyltransferase family 4 protein [Thermodesulfatator indicus]AEH44590.1 glycosyl transferase group 1 [Thermodesulfatator indicus DSM 15286]
MRLRVLQLGSPTGLYGAERWILALIKYLAPEKVETIVGVIRDDPALSAPLLSEAQKLGFETVAINAYGRFNPEAVKKLRAYLKEKGIHILHTHGYKQDLAGFLATRGLKTKIIATPHGWSKEPDFKLAVYETLNRLVFLGLDKVVPLSKEIYQGLLRIPGLKRKLTLIVNAVDLSEIEAVKDVPEEVLARKKEGFFILGYIGQLIHRKGLDILLKALSHKELSDCFLFVVGEGPLKNELKALAKKLGLFSRVAFTGYREDRLNFLRGFDVFVLPSRLEGIPRCLMEAMGMGKPVVASAIEGVMDLIPEDGEGGLLFPVKDAHALAQKIAIFKGDQKLRENISQKARQIVAEKFSAERMAREYEALYQSLFS